MTGWAPVLCGLAAAAGLRVETSTPDALCPDLGQVREAAEARLGAVEGPGEWRASYGLIHRPDGAEAGDVVRLELHDPAGRLRLRRELPRAGESCAALARALVVVLDSYFRHPSDASEATPVPGSAVARAPAITVTRAPVASGPPGSRLSLDVAAGWVDAWLGGRRASPALVLGLRLGVVPHAWSAGIDATALLGEQTQRFGAATATLRGTQLRGFFARELLGGGRVELRAGPELLLALDRADAEMLVGGASHLRAAFGGGLRTQLQLRVAARLLLSLSAALDYAPAAWAGTFLVENASTETEIFPSSRVRLMVAGGLSWAIF
jgi:hypothetical protein